MFERFSDNSAYAFNTEHPSGVFYLQPGAADRLAAALRKYGNPPSRSVLAEVVGSSDEAGFWARLLEPEDHPVVRPRGPLNVWFHISNSCNLACSYCYIPGLRKAVSAPIPGSTTEPDDVSEVIKSLHSICVARGFGGLHLRFAGGEPLLALDAIEQACRISARLFAESGLSITFAVLTNGTLLPARFFSLLRRYRFTGISISLDGAEPLHNEYRFEGRQRSGTWKTILANIKTLKDNGHSPYILTTLTARNYASIDEFVDTCVEHRLGFRLSPVRDRNTPRIPGLQDSIVEKLRPIYRRLPALLPITRPIQNYANFAEWSPGVKKSTACGTCRSSLAIGQHGGVATCQMRLDRNYGSIAREPAVPIFDGMISDPANWRFLAPNNMSGGCTQCKWRYSCSGGCPEHTMGVYRTYDRPSPWCKLYGDFLPIYYQAIATQIKLAADRLA
ncbi:MAG: radical SAM protein [Bryobacterales bacterium]|nr:radical SAM protein [Bryobacterales bacterium]